MPRHPRQKTEGMLKTTPISYFFDSGLRFACQRCGVCCTGTPGVIRVSTGEIETIAAFLEITPERFTRDYLIDLEGGWSIGEHTDGRCRFYADGCRIYPVRPRQCRSYPFWFNILRSERSWQREGRQCAGIGRGRFYSREEILDLVARDMDSRLMSGGVENEYPIINKDYPMSM